MSGRPAGRVTRPRERGEPIRAASLPLLIQTRPSPPEPPPLLLEGLNAEQQEAVLASEGPLFVLAGAGTGKTRVICSRIARLLQPPSGLSPAQLLALTFSRRAAQEMLERVERLHGTYADEMGIFTFHGFCHRFLQDHALELKLPPRFRLLDQTEAWVFFRELLPELRLRRHGSLADPAGCIEGLLRFISRAKDELVSPREYLAHVRALQDPEERGRGVEVARAYRIYQQRMAQAGHLDFGDLIVRTLQALRDRPALLRELRRRYQAILVDEFQDTNVAQIELLSQMAGSGEGLCVVGDDDQAIYRFRGASFASFILMKQHFPKVRTVRLTRNYRSSPVILSAAGRLIRHNEPDRYDPGKRVWTEEPGGAPVEVVRANADRQEAEEAARVIRRIWEGQPAAARRWDRIAVLYRAHAHRDRLVELLRSEGIPFAVRGGSFLFDQPEIRDLIALLQVLQDPSDGLALYRLLAHPLWGIPGGDLVALCREARDSERPLVEVLRSASDPALQEETRSSVSQLIGELDRLRREGAGRGVEDLVMRAVEETFLRAAFRLPPVIAGGGPPVGAGGGPPGRAGDPVVSLGRFLRLTYRYARNHPDRRDLASFLRYLDSLRQAPGNDSGEEEDPAADAVRLMTVHQAKGLEFDWVVVLGLTQGRFPARNRPEAVPFPVELMKESLPRGDYHLQEERRLFYVACTRARRGLVLLTQDRSRFRPSTFVREILREAPAGEVLERALEPLTGSALEDLPGPAPERVSLAAERETLELLARIRRLRPEDEEGFARALRRLQELAGSCWRDRRAIPLSAIPARVPVGERLSFTQLETYRFCPMKYLYGYVYRLPSRPTPQMALGTDLHECLERFFAEVMRGRVPPPEELRESFLRLHQRGRYGEPHQDEGYRRMGEDLLARFYRKHEGSFRAPLFVERPFLLRLGEVALQGFVDRVDALPGGGVEVLDYKSGKPKEAADFEGRLQLLVYALAAREVFGLEPRRVTFYYLQGNSTLSFDPEPQELEQARETILGIAGQIRSGDFTPAPSVGKCRRCDFRGVCPASVA
ncbi:MAG: ATP-dependent helicase [Candidatus Omnitrophica bacterium]|nr:ATP-dependent helicase [Candidatus Omnitrophota bacterium]